MATVYMVEEKRGKKREYVAVSPTRKEAEATMAMFQQRNPKGVYRVKGTEVKQ